jgi:hypothetical protein
LVKVRSRVAVGTAPCAFGRPRRSF